MISARSTDSNGTAARNTQDKVRITYPVALFAENEDARASLSEVLHSSKNLTLVSELKDTETRTIRKLKNIYPSLIIMHLDKDAHLNEQAVTTLRYAWPDAGLVMYSASDDDTLIKRSFQMGADGFVLEEKQHASLASLVHDYLRKGIPPVSTKILSKIIGLLKMPAADFRQASTLSNKQRAIAVQLVDGKSYEEIAQELNMRLDAVRYHIKQIYSKLNINKSTQLSRKILG